MCLSSLSSSLRVLSATAISGGTSRPVSTSFTTSVFLASTFTPSLIPANPGSRTSGCRKSSSISFTRARLQHSDLHLHSVDSPRFLDCLQKYETHPFVKGFAVLLSVWSILPTIGVRPRAFTLLFAAIYLALLYQFVRRKQTKAIWWLVPMMVVWVNLHAGYLIGLVLIGVTIVGVVVYPGSIGETLGSDWPRLKTVVLILVACLVAVLLSIRRAQESSRFLSSSSFHRCNRTRLPTCFHRTFITRAPAATAPDLVNDCGPCALPKTS